MECQKHINSINELNLLAMQLSQVLSPGDVVFLKGDLGAGKTTFCQAFFKALGYHDLVKSPTYTLVEDYTIQGQRYFHFDLYRLRDPMELYNIGIEDYFSCDSVVLIEWPDKGRGVLMPPTLTINITIESEKTRILTISTDDNKFIDLFDQMDQDRR